MKNVELQKFFRGKRVFVTGHTGFKGSWLCQMLLQFGAQVWGYALAPDTAPSLFDLLHLSERMHSTIGDVRDFDALKLAFFEAQPQIVLHLAAQPIVKEGYRNPVGTFASNVMGTVHLLECVRLFGGVESLVNVTTDKVYAETGRESGYAETDVLDGFDPYANSKSCSELVTACYRRSFLEAVPVSTARAGNVIGGGDFAPSRIIPDCVRAAQAGEPIVLRNPHSVRPYQHVLEPLIAYLTIAARQCENPALAGEYNVGPDADGCVTTGELAGLFCDSFGAGMQCIVRSDGGPHEAAFLKLDCTKLKNTFGWKPVFSVREAVELTTQWTKCWLSGGDLQKLMNEQTAIALQRNKGSILSDGCQ
ncbi:MAG: CDP-glucose 4,6-dehydratase [Oscillospiraceae bacterium]|nr:CDP-glucose 4,6-dehydratase [Oscillospiraceae bacterium]